MQILNTHTKSKASQQKQNMSPLFERHHRRLSMDYSPSQQITRHDANNINHSSANILSEMDTQDSGMISVENMKRRNKQHGGNLPNDIQERMENSFGADFSNVRIHKESHLANKLSAKAFTQGNEIHFAPGEYNPKSSLGQEILSHELSHVLQHRQGKVQCTHQEMGHNVSDQLELESEADRHSKIVSSGGKIHTVERMSEPLHNSHIQDKSSPLLLYRSLPSGSTILSIVPDVDNIYLACSNLAWRVAGGFAGNVSWSRRIGVELEGPLAANSLTPFRKSFTETEGLNMDWSVSIGWRINSPREIGSSTSEVTRTGGGSVVSRSGSTGSSTDSAGLSASAGGHEGAPGGGATAGTTSTQGVSESQDVTLNSGVSRTTSERAHSYTAQLVAAITVSGSANFSGSDYVNPFKWGSAGVTEALRAGPQSGNYAAGRINYRNSS